MQKYTIRITKAAEADLIGIVEYIALDDQVAALKMADKIEERILTLEDFPYSGSVPRNRSLANKGYRILIVEQYLVFYVLFDEQTVEIRRIVSGKMDYSNLI